MRSPISALIVPMTSEVTVQRRNRTHAVVEGALLGDIAIVFLLMRAFLPLPGVRQLLRAVATVPFVMLTQRRGLKLSILAAIASYTLFASLVGPLLALAAVDIAVAGILAGVGRRAGLGPRLNLLWTAPVYTLFDLIIPTIAGVFIFRYPVKTLSDAARNFVKLVFGAFHWVAQRLGASPTALHDLDAAKGWFSLHWQVGWVASLLVYGLLTMYLAIYITEAVLKQMPDTFLVPQRAAP